VIDRHWTVSARIGPCSEEEADGFTQAAAEWSKSSGLGAAWGRELIVKPAADSLAEKIAEIEKWRDQAEAWANEADVDVFGRALFGAQQGTLSRVLDLQRKDGAA
jgi:hypothetical protein